LDHFKLIERLVLKGLLASNSTQCQSQREHCMRYLLQKAALSWVCYIWRKNDCCLDGVQSSTQKAQPKAYPHACVIVFKYLEVQEFKW